MGRLAGDNRARLIAATAAGLLLIAAAVLAFAADSKQRVAGTNLLAPLNPTVEVRPGGRACERIRHLPAGAAAVRIRADAGAGEISPRVKISKGDALVSSGSARGPEGTIEVPLDPATEAIRDARVCVSNAGREALLLYGERKRAPGGFRYRYGVTFLEDGSSSFLTRADVVSRRFHNGQAGALGAWAMWLALALGVAAGALALALQLRVSR
jgi:hypothetical protein